MPRYFFDLHNDLDVRDEEGCELPDFEAAKDHAQHEARKMVEAKMTRNRMPQTSAKRRASIQTSRALVAG
jgi:hypothetical protein